MHHWHICEQLGLHFLGMLCFACGSSKEDTELLFYLKDFHDELNISSRWALQMLPHMLSELLDEKAAQQQQQQQQQQRTNDPWAELMLERLLRLLNASSTTAALDRNNPNQQQQQQRAMMCATLRHHLGPVLVRLTQSTPHTTFDDMSSRLLLLPQRTQQQ